MRRLPPILAVLAAAIGCTASAPAVLDPDSPSRALRLAWVDAAVAERSCGAAPVTTVYRLEALPEEAPLARLLRELARGPRPSAASVQLAVWAASGVSDLPAGARALLDAALRLLVAAGLDPAGLPIFARHPS